MPLEKIHLLTRMDSVSARFLINALDKADPRGFRHAFSVAEISYVLGARLKSTKVSAEELWLAGLLHDIGLLGVPKTITDKKKHLSPAQRDYIKHHPQLSKYMVDHLFTSPSLSEAVLCHHERMDGKGYPGGRAGDAIPYMARIIAVADAYDTMRSAGWLFAKKSHDSAVAELRECAGTQFDAGVVKLFHRQRDAIYVAYEKVRSLKHRDIMKRL